MTENATAPTIATADLLDEYGAALRGSWADIDGRSEKVALENLSDAIREHGASPLDAGTVTMLRACIGVCPTGGRHWIEFCDEDCTA